MKVGEFYKKGDQYYYILEINEAENKETGEVQKVYSLLQQLGHEPIGATEESGFFDQLEKCTLEQVTTVLMGIMLSIHNDIVALTKEFHEKLDSPLLIPDFK